MTVTDPPDLGTVLDAAIDAGVVPGLVAAAVRGDDVRVEVRGLVGPGGAPMRRDTIVRIASITKPIVAAAAMTLVEDGRLELDDPVEEWLPELAGPRVLRRPDADLDDTVAARRPITVEDVLSFRAGIGMLPEFPLRHPIQHAYVEAGLGAYGPPRRYPLPEPDAWMRRLGALPLLAQPGERWFYDTPGDVAGVLLARVTGRCLADLLDERIFQPLGMRDTGFSVPPERLDRFCPQFGHGPDGSLVVTDPVHGAWASAPAFASGAGGLVSTLDDLLAFTGMLRVGGAGVLSACSVSEMTTDRLTDRQRRDAAGFLDGEGWGLGMAVGADGRYGWDGGLGTGWRSDPARDVTSVLLTQVTWDSPDGPRLLHDLRDAVHRRVVPRSAP